MSRSKRKKPGTRAPTRATAKPPLDPLQTGMPSMDSVRGVDEFKRGNQVLRIIHTNERDEYDPVPSKPKRNKRP